jgi:hypothetical protein
MAPSIHHHPKYIKTMSTAKGKAGQLNIHELEHLSRRRAKVMAEKAKATLAGKVMVPSKITPNTYIYIEKKYVSDYMQDYKKPQSQILQKLYALYLDPCTQTT